MLYVLKKVFSCHILQDTKVVCPFRKNSPITKVVCPFLENPPSTKVVCPHLCYKRIGRSVIIQRNIGENNHFSKILNLDIQPLCSIQSLYSLFSWFMLLIQAERRSIPMSLSTVSSNFCLVLLSVALFSTRLPVFLSLAFL